MKMSWRRVLSVVLALFVPVPLVWLVFIAMSGSSTHVPLPRGKTLVPMLSHEERLRLSTYERDCSTDADCDPQLRCVYDVPTTRYRCTDSKCSEDEHCPEGSACIPRAAANDKDVIRVCALLGVRKEGELCERTPFRRKDGCERGLVCYGLCGRPCQVDEPDSCPEGYFCQEGSEASSCLPTCEGRSCPEGQRCVQLMEKASVCMTIHGQDCERTPCARELHCTHTTYPSTPGEIWMECLRDCGESKPPCPEGTVCYLFQCRKSCDPQDSSVCDPTFRCGRSHPSMPWACLPGNKSRKKD